MEFLSTVYRQVARIYGRLTASQRATFLLLVAMIVGSLVLLVVLGSGGDWVTLTAGPMSGEAFAKAAAELNRADIDYRDRGGQLEVRRGERYRALAALSEGKALPSDGPAFGWNELLSQSSGIGNMRTVGEQQFQQQIALQTELARTLREFRGVRNAKVLLTQAPRRRLNFRASPPQKASVSLVLEPGVELSSRLVESVASLVQGAVLALKPQNVTVIDAVRGLCRRVPEEALAFGGDLLEQKRTAEKYLRGRLYDNLVFVGPDRIVDVCVELRPQRETRTTDTVDADASVIPRRSVERTKRTTSTPPAGAGPAAGTSGGAALGGTAAPTSVEEEITDEVLDGRYSTARGRIDIPAGTIERITAVVVMPLRYYREMAAKSLPEGQEPDEQQVLALANQDKDRIQQIALNTLGKKAKAEDITVDTRFIPTEPMLAAVVGGGGAGRLAERYGPTAVLVGLSLAFLVLLSRWVKRPAAAAAAPAGLIGVAAGAAGAGAEEPILLPAGGDQSVEVKRQAEMRKRIEQLVQQDPANAAGLVSRWLNEG